MTDVRGRSTALRAPHAPFGTHELAIDVGINSIHGTIGMSAGEEVQRH
ncbi:hypothetical protein [Streptomyces sp. NPDC059649]